MNSRFAEVAGRIQLALAAAIVIAAAFAWPNAPERIPVHWNVHGAVDRWGGRVEGILALPAVVILLSVLQRVLPRLDPRRAEYAKFAGAWAGIWLATTVVMACVYAALLLAMHGHAVDMSRLGTLLVGGLFIVLGGFMGQLRPNWFAGVRTPWTMSSRTSWIRTHRLAGRMFIVTGVVVWAATLVSPPVAAYTLAAGVITTVIASTVYSYVVWRDAEDKAPPAGSSPAE